MRIDMRIAALTLLAFPLWGASRPAAKPDSVGLSEQRLHRIHDAIQRHIDAHDISGAVTLVARKGRIVHLEAHGLMDIESNKPMNTGAIFRIWSMSKPVTGVAILMLMEEGKVRLNDPVSRFIPEFKDMKVAVPLEHSSPQRVLRHPRFPRNHGAGSAHAHLRLRQRSGERRRHAQDHVEGRRPETLAHFIPQLAAIPARFPTRLALDSTARSPLRHPGRIVEIASGQTFDQFLRERIFEPLGMKETFFHPGEDCGRASPRLSSATTT